MGKGKDADEMPAIRKRKEMRAVRKQESCMAPEKKERCILCGKVTEMAQDCPVLEREYYLEGAGQLCRECYQEIYIPSHNENTVQLGGLLWTGTARGMEGSNGKHKT